MQVKSNRLTRHRIQHGLLIVLLISGLALVVAKIFLFFAAAEIRWPLGFIGVVAFGCLTAVVRDKVRFLLGSLLLSSTIAMAFFLWSPVGPLYPHRSGPQPAPELYVFDLPLFLLFIVLILRKYPRDQFRNLYRIDLAILLLLFFCLLSFISSTYCILSLTGILLMVRMAMIYYCVSRGVSRQKDVKTFVILLLMCLIAESVLGLCQAQLGVLKWLQTTHLTEATLQTFEMSLGSISVARPFGTFDWTGPWANYLGMLSPFALSVFWFCKSKSERALGIIAYSIGILGLVVSVQRQDWIHVPLVFVLLAFIAYRRSKGQKANMKRKLLVLFFMMVVVGSVFSGYLKARMHQGVDDSAYSRLPYAKVALQIIREEPISGVGLNNYTEVMHRYDKKGVLRELGLEFAVHNELLHITAEIGVFGLFAYLLIWWLAVNNVVFCLRHAQGWSLTASAGAAGALMAMFVHRQFGPYWLGAFQLNVILWSLFGLTEALRSMIIRDR